MYYNSRFPFQVPRIHQKRLLAFVNHFVAETVGFLNALIKDCDTKFVAYESKLRKVEDSLAILEAKLSSVPDLSKVSISNEAQSIPVPVEASQPKTTEEKQSDTTEVTKTPDPSPVKQPVVAPESTTAVGIKASEDWRYKKYFKMITFGVPQQAVKNKLSSEGLDPSILEYVTR